MLTSTNMLSYVTFLRRLGLSAARVRLSTLLPPPAGPELLWLLPVRATEKVMRAGQSSTKKTVTMAATASVARRAAKV